MNKEEMLIGIEHLVSLLEIEYGVSVVFEPDGEDVLYHDGRAVQRGDFITINSRHTLRKRLFTLLHEAGHVALRTSAREHKSRFPFCKESSKKTRSYRVDTLREEVLAWEAATQLYKDLGVNIDEAAWSRARTDALRKYIDWAAYQE